MNSTDHTYAAKNVAAGVKAQSRYPRLLILLPARAGFDEAPSVLADSLSAEGWPATIEMAGGSDTGEADGGWAWLPGPMRGFIARIQALIRQIPKHDLVHVVGQSSRQIVREGLLSIVLARFFGKKVVLHFVSAEVERLLERRRKWLMPFLNLADCIVVGSRYLQKVFDRANLEVRVVAQPLANDRVNHQSLENLQPRILVNCELEPDLNVGCAIRAFRLVKQKYPRAELIIVGEGGQRSALERNVGQDSFCDVEFLGDMTENEVVELYQSCDLYLHTPLVDESPASLVRAFAAGLPVVVTDADGLLHMVRDGVSALIVTTGDHVAVADAIIELVENPELTKKLSRQGAGEARKYTWARVRQDWVNLYTGLQT